MNPHIRQASRAAADGLMAPTDALVDDLDGAFDETRNVAPPAVTGWRSTFWEDFVEGDIITGPGLTVTDAHLVSWAGLTGDFVSLHLDEQYAAASPFGRRVAAGPFTMSIALGLLTQTGVFGNVRAWLGVDAVRATAPVFIGDTIRPCAVVRETMAGKLSDLGSWTLDYTVTNQREEVVMTFISRKLVYKRAAGR